MIYLFDKDEKLIKIVRKSAVKTALQKCAFTPERYVSDRLTVELKGLNADELEQVEYMAIQTMEDAHTFHYFYVAQKFSDELTTLIGVQSGIEELRKSPVYDKRPQNAIARDVITDLLAGTNWQARFVGETTAHSTNFYYTSVFDALKKVCEVWDLEMQFFVEMNGNRIGGRYIDFKQRIGQAVGKRVVYGHNALQILQEVERTNIFTALIGRGKGEETSEGYGRKITFENVVWSTTQGKPVNKPAGQKYLELPLMTRQYGIKNADGSMRPKIGFVDFSEEENPEVLIERTYKALVDAARPQLTLKTSSVYLKGVKVGDTIRVVRHDKKLDYDTRIFEITFNRLNNQSSDIKLGDRIGESNEAKVQTIADKAVEQFVNNEFSNFVQNLPDYLPSADGFNNNWYGAEDPTVQYPGKVLINDIWYKPDSEHEGYKIMLRWTGEVWEEILRTYDSEALRDRIAEEIAQVNQSMQAQSDEHDRQVADILSKTQSVELLANQAKTDAANAITEAIRLDTIERQATETKVANAKSQAIAEATQMVETAKSLLSGQISNVSTDLSQTKESIKLLATTATVDALTGRISSAESTLQVQAGEIASRVKTSDFDQAKQRISTAESSITQLGNRITTEISEVEGKIPTKIGATNYIRDFGFANSYAFSGNRSVWQFERIADSTARSGYHVKATCTQAGGDGFHRVLIDLRGAEWQGRTMTYAVDVKTSKSVKMRLGVEAFNTGYKTFDATTTWQRFISTDTVNYKTYYSFIFYTDSITWSVGDVIYLRDPQLEDGTVATAPRIAEEDLTTDITSIKTTITQTASGVEQLSTSLATTDGKVTTAETKISQLISDVSSKVSQTDYNTLTGRVSSAETAITQNATEISKRLTSTQVEQAITDKGYATVTALNNKVKETSDSFSRTISETKALIPSEFGGNLLVDSGKGWSGLHVVPFERSTKLYAGSTYTVTARWGRQDNSTLNVGLRQQGGDWQWVNLAYNPQIDAWTKTFVSQYNIETTDIFRFYTVEETGIGSANWATLVKGPLPLASWQPSASDLATVTALHNVTDTVDSHTRTIVDQGNTISQTVQTAQGLVSQVSSLVDSQNLVYDPTNYSMYAEREPNSNLVVTGTGEYKLLRITQSGLTADAYKGFAMPLHSQKFVAGEKLSYRVNLWVDVLPDDNVGFEIKAGGPISLFSIRPDKTGNNQIFTGTFTVSRTVTATDEFGLHVWLKRNGSVRIGQISIVRGDKPPSSFVDSTSAMQLATSTQVSTLAGSYAIKNLTNSGTVLNQLNLNKDGTVKIDGKLVQITGTTYIQDGVISSAKIANLDAGKITTGTLNAARIATNSITGSHIVFDQAFFNSFMANEAYLQQLFAKNAFITQVQAVAISASKIQGGIMEATNGAVQINLNDGAFNFYTDSPAIRRSVTNLPNQFVKFATANEANDNTFKVLSNDTKTTAQASVTSIGTNRSNGEQTNDGSFTGINIYASGPATGTTVVDRIGMHSDILIVSHSVSEGQKGWVFENHNASNNNYAIRPMMPRGLSDYSSYIGTDTHPITRLFADDVMLNGHRLKGILKDIANRIGKTDGWAADIS